MHYAAVIRYGNQDKIARVRPEHRAYLAQLKEQGQLFTSGPFSDDSGALIIYVADSETAARAMIDADPFKKAGVFQEIQLYAWKKVL